MCVRTTARLPEPYVPNILFLTSASAIYNVGGMDDPSIENVRHSDGYEASVRWWLPAQPRGAILYFHGIESHGGWYEGSGSMLAELGWAILMPDRRGSGRNERERGHAESHHRLLSDGAELINAITARCGIARVHLVGVSWGGKFACALAATEAQRVASLSLVAPGLFPVIDVPAGEKLRIAWELLADPRRAHPLPIHHTSMFTNNPLKRDFVERDPLRLCEATAAFLLASRRLDRVARSLGGSAWRGGVHALLAGQDRIIDNARTREFVRGLVGSATRITEYAGAAHTLEFEPDPQPFWHDLAKGIKELSSP